MPFFRLRRGWLWSIALLAGLLIAAPVPASADQKEDKKQQEKVSKEQKQEAEALVKLVDEAMKGQPAPADFTLGWRNDFMKSRDLSVYVPFTLSVDPSAINSRSLGMYLRVVAKTPPPAAPATKEAGTETKDAPAPPLFAFEDIHLVELKDPVKGQPYRFSRAIQVRGGEYDVYLAVRERKLGKNQKPKVTVHKQTLAVPDYANGQLTTSTVIVADAVEPLAAGLSPEEQLEKPYTIGTAQITPATDDQFAKNQDLNLIFFIYNPTLKEKKPDLTVEYKFHRKTAEGEKYFNKTEPTKLSAETLPPTFDLDAGFQLSAPLSVPLASFPEGDYRLEIEITDNFAQKKLTREVFFTVLGS